MAVFDAVVVVAVVSIFLTLTEREKTDFYNVHRYVILTFQAFLTVNVKSMDLKIDEIIAVVAEKKAEQNKLDPTVSDGRRTACCLFTDPCFLMPCNQPIGILSVRAQQ